jgi:hypothetical protein
MFEFGQYDAAAWNVSTPLAREVFASPEAGIPGNPAASWSSSTTRRTDHARRELNPSRAETRALEQGEDDRSKAAAPCAARLVDTDEASDREANP